MGKILTVVLGLAVVLGTAYYVLNRQAGIDGGSSQPKRQLDNVRNAATRIETEAQQNADQIFQRSQ